MLRRLILLLCLAGLLVPVPASALQRAVPTKSSLPTLQTAAPTGRVVVKFREEADVMLTASGLTSRAGGTAARLSALLAREAPGAGLAPHFAQPASELDALRRRAEARSGRHLPDLGRYLRITPAGPVDHTALLHLLRVLAADPAVETAFLEPVAVPAALGFDAFKGRTGTAFPHTAMVAGAVPATTPDFSPLQGYLDPAPDGVDAWGVAVVAGADGADVKVIDVEGGWLWTHEDLPEPFATLGAQIDDEGWRNHGTAVLGEIRGQDNGFGIRGIAPACSVGASSVGDQSTAEAIVNAVAVLDPGDLILIELHAPGPNANGAGQYGYVPMEFWQDNFDAILLASASGLIVCEAAGNGQQDLDEPVYLGLFDRSVRDSGAIMCGASAGMSLEPAWFTNFGARVDLHGWGSSVVTCGYGHLQGLPDFPETEWYTDSFNGTSSASPIVTGAVVSLQGMVKTAFGTALDAGLARTILIQTGTPQEGSEHIGPRPDLTAAWALAAAGIGGVAGTVSDGANGLPLADVHVLVEQTGAFDISTSDGSYGFPLLPGNYDLTFSSFFYEILILPTTVTSGASSLLDAALTARPTLAIAGKVYAHIGAPLAGVRITPLGVPLAPVISGAAGGFRIEGAPTGELYRLLFDNQPGYGVEYREVATADFPFPEVPLFLTLPVVEEDFELTDGGFLADSLWTWGTPQAGGPTGGFSGERCWGIGMTEDYRNDVTGRLYSPVQDFGFTPIEHLLLSFHYWSETEAGFDGVQLQVFKNGNFETRTPLSDYTDLSLGGQAYGPGWSGNSGGWRGTVFDLTDLIGPEFTFRLVFGADPGVNGAGFWIDDIAWDTGGDLAAVPAEGDAPPPAPGPALTAFPNPFNPRTVIAWRVASPGPLQLAIYDLRGRQVRSLLDGPVSATAGTVTWDGCDRTGRRSASGVYLVRLRDAQGTTASLQLTLLQ
jgi:serine protease